MEIGVIELIVSSLVGAAVGAFCGWIRSGKEYSEYSGRERLRQGWALLVGFGLVGALVAPVLVAVLTTCWVLFPLLPLLFVGLILCELR